MQEAFPCHLHVPNTLCLPQNRKQGEGAGKLPIITGSFIVVHVDSLQLQVTVSMVTARGVDPMLIADDLPKLAIKKTA